MQFLHYHDYDIFYDAYSQLWASQQELESRRNYISNNIKIPEKSMTKVGHNQHSIYLLLVWLRVDSLKLWF